MLKTVLYGLLMLTTSVRLVDIVYLLAKDSTNLPAAVLLVSTLMVVYGVALLFKRLVSNVTLRQLMHFYVIQSGLIAFNLFYIAAFSPLRIGAFETIAAGTFLDILVNCCLVYLCTKQIRSSYFAVVKQEVTNRHA